MFNNARSNGIATSSEQTRSPYQLSDVRTGPVLKRRRTASQDSALHRPLKNASSRGTGGQTQTCDLQAFFDDIICMDSACPPSEVCVDCVVDCQDEDCQAGPEGQCTDPCMSESCSEQTECVEVCTKETCEGEPCSAGDACLRLMDDSVSQNSVMNGG